MENFTAPSLQQIATTAVEFLFRHSLLWYQAPAAVAWLLLFVVSLQRDDPRTSAASAIRSGDVRYLVTLAVFLFAVRWPVLALGDLEGDESVAVSAALTRYLDPAYGLTLFTGSAGPLLTYPVSLLGLLGLRIDYGASKLLVQLLMTASSALTYLALRTLSEARIARIALLPLLVFLGFGSTRWMLYYCSEHWINLLVISMIYGVLRLGQGVGRERVNLCVVGIALGLMPLIKWQGMPMAALFALVAAAIVARRSVREHAGLRALAVRLLPLAGLGLAPLLLWCAILWSSGSLGYFYATYFSALFTQATSRFESTFVERLMAFPEWGFTRSFKELLFVGATAMFWAPAAIYLCLVRRRRRELLDLALAALYFVASAYAVIQPGGAFLHYLNLLLPPYAFLCILAFVHLVKVARPAIVIGVYLGLTVALPGYEFVRRVPLPVRFPPAVVPTPTIDNLLAVAAPGSRLILWGWEYYHYVYAGMIWGTRTGGSHEILEPFFPDKGVYVRDYVESLESGGALIFLDTATEGSSSYDDRARYGHETQPEIADAVGRNYFLCGEFPAARMYLLKRYGWREDIHAWCKRQPRRRPNPRRRTAVP